MTDLRELIKAWRDQANCVDVPTPISAAYSACANQLERALAAQPAPSINPEALLWAYARRVIDGPDTMTTELRVEAMREALEEVGAQPATVPEAVPAITKAVCDGCPHLNTEYWRDCLDNDETDSGTLAKCMHSIPAKTINVYWNKGHAAPSWCPLAAAPSPAAVAKDRADEMIEAIPGLPLPRWLLESAERISEYMARRNYGQWEIGGIQSRRFDRAQPKPAEGGADDIMEIAVMAESIALAKDRRVSDTQKRKYTLADARSAAQTIKERLIKIARPVTAGSEADDYECRAHACRRRIVEMQGEIDRLRKLVSGSGEAVAVGVVLDDGRNHPAGSCQAALFAPRPAGTKLYAGAAPTGCGEAVAEMVAIEDGLGTVFVEFREGKRPPAGTKLYAGAPPAAEDTEIANRVRAMQGALKKTDKPLAYACALALANLVADSNADRGRFALEGVTQNGEQRGDWTVLVQAGIAPPTDAEALIRECVPGGDICDPQQVADNIRDYFGRLSGGEG